MEERQKIETKIEQKKKHLQAVEKHIEELRQARIENSHKARDKAKNERSVIDALKKNSKEYSKSILDQLVGKDSKPFDKIVSFLFKYLVGITFASVFIMLLRFKYTWLSSHLPSYFVIFIMIVGGISLFLFATKSGFLKSILKTKPFVAKFDIWMVSFLIGFIWNSYKTGDEPSYTVGTDQYVFAGSKLSNAMNWTTESWLHLSFLIAIPIVIWGIRAITYQERKRNYNVGADVFDGDQPVKSAVDDLFLRQDFAKSITRVINEKGSDSLTVGLYGEWGSGKSSLFQMIKEFGPDHAIFFEFKPWYFGQGYHDIIHKFLTEFINEVTKSGKGYNPELEKKVYEYSRALSSISWRPGQVIFSFKEILEKLIPNQEQESLSSLKKSIEDLMAKINSPVVVLIDDIDRLDSEEIRMVFKLVRLVADFPNVTYLLALDEEVVVEALAKDFSRHEKDAEKSEQKGRDYLDKFIQIPLFLPLIQPYVLGNMCWDGIERIADRHQLGKDREGKSGKDDHFTLQRQEFLDHLVRIPINPRKIKRYLNTLEVLIPLLRGKVNLNDLFYLILIKVSAPRLYDFIRRPTTSSYFLEQVEQIDPENQNFVSAFSEYERLLTDLFPYSIQLFGGSPNVGQLKLEEEQRLGKRRISSPKMFARYFTYGLQEGELTDIIANEFLKNMLVTKDVKKFQELYDGYLSGFNRDDSHQMLKAVLRDYEDAQVKEIFNRLVILYCKTVQDIDSDGAKQLQSLITYIAHVIKEGLLDTLLLSDGFEGRNAHHLIIRVCLNVRTKFLSDRNLKIVSDRFIRQIRKHFVQENPNLWNSLDQFLSDFLEKPELLKMDNMYRMSYYAALLQYVPHEILNLLQEDYLKNPDQFNDMKYIELWVDSTRNIYNQIYYTLEEILDLAYETGHHVGFTGQLRNILRNIQEYGDKERIKDAGIYRVLEQVEKHNAEVEQVYAEQYELMNME